MLFIITTKAFFNNLIFKIHCGCDLIAFHSTGAENMLSKPVCWHIPTNSVVVGVVFRPTVRLARSNP